MVLMHTYVHRCGSTVTKVKREVAVSSVHESDLI